MRGSRTRLCLRGGRSDRSSGASPDASVSTIGLTLVSSDPQRDKRFSGTTKLPHVPRPRMSLCILADAADIDRAKQIELEYMSVEDLKKLNKNKKLVKKVRLCSRRQR